VDSSRARVVAWWSYPRPGNAGVSTSYRFCCENGVGYTCSTPLVDPGLNTIAEHAISEASCRCLVVCHDFYFQSEAQQKFETKWPLSAVRGVKWILVLRRQEAIAASSG